MTAREFAFIVSRAMGVYLFIATMSIVPTNIGMAASFQYDEAGSWLGMAAVCLLSLVYLSLALWFWVKAGWLAGHMMEGIAGPASADEERQLDAVSVVQVGVSLIGVYVLSEAFPKATQAVMLMVFQNQAEHLPDLSPSLVASWVSLGVQLAIGVCLMFGAGSLARLIGWARVAGVVKGPNDGGEV